MAHIGPDEVVRRYLEAEARIEPLGDFVAGRLLTTGTVIEEVNARAGAAAQHAVANVRSLHVREVTPDHAVVDLDAFVLHDVKWKHGRQTNDFRFRGPVTLVDEDGLWKITRVVADHVTYPDAVYDPFIEERVAGCSLTMFAQPTKRGTAVFARVVNESDRPVEVSELACAVPWARFFTLRWGSVHVPAVIKPGERWASMTAWSPLPLRRRIRGRIIVGGEDLSVDFVPAAAHPWTWRARRRRVDWNVSILVLIVALGIVNAVLTDWRGLGFLGLGLAGIGVLAACRGAILELVGFPSPGSRVLTSVGAGAAITGSLILVTHGFGWLSTAAILATVVFAMQPGFVGARYVRKLRSANR